MCSLTVECVLLLSYYRANWLTLELRHDRYCRMCSLTVECVLLLSYYRANWPTLELRHDRYYTKLN